MTEKLQGWRLVCYEIKMELLEWRWIVLIPMSIALWYGMLHFNLQRAYYHGMDYINGFLEGMSPFLKSGTEKFLIPGEWTAFFLLLLYLNGKMTKNYADGMGTQILIRTGTVSGFWYTKCLAVIIRVSFYFVSAYLIIFLFAAGTNTENELLTDWQEIEKQIFLPCAAACVICIWQAVVSVFAGSITGFLGMSVMLIASAYSCKWYLPGNYLMKLRVNELLDEKGLLFIRILIAVSGIAGVYCGKKVFENIDYMRGKGDL